MSYKDGAELSKAAKDAVEEAREQINTFLKDHTMRPAFLRLAFYDAILQHPIRQAGELKRSIQLSRHHEVELEQDLKSAITKLDTIKASPRLISYADLYQLAGIEAIKYLTKEDITLQYGRPDFYVPVPREDIALFSSMEKGDDVASMKTIFNHLGFTNKEIVALYSAIIYWTNPSLFTETSLGQVDLWSVYKLITRETKPKEGPNVKASSSTDTTKQRTSEIRVETTLSKSVGRPLDPSSKESLVPQSTVSNASGTSITQMSATKRTWDFLLSNSSFRKHVDYFAENPQQLQEAYLAAHRKLSELGFQPSSKFAPLETKEYHDIQHGVAIAVVMTIIVGVVGFFYETMLA